MTVSKEELMQTVASMLDKVNTLVPLSDRE